MKKKSLKEAYPQIANEWDYKKNNPTKPEEVSRATSKKFWWVCPNKHSYYSSVAHRTGSNSNCPYCAHGRVTNKNNLEFVFPELLKEWDYAKNKFDPSKVSSTSQYRVWWKCKNAHIWNQSIKSRTQEMSGKSKYRVSGCPKCASFIAENNQLANEWDYKKNEELKPEDFRSSSQKKVWWKCIKGHEWKASISNRFKGAGCLYCNAGNSTSKLELRIYAELVSLFEFVEHRKKIEGQEIDIFIPSLNSAIEVDGAFWHKEKKNKDLQKNNHFKERGIKLYRIREKGLAKIDSQDVILKTKDIKISDVFELLKVISKTSELPKKAKGYLKKAKWVNDSYYRELLEIFPNPLPGTSVAEKFQEISLEWSDRNLPLRPENFSSGSHEKMWWKCKNGHEWEAGIKERTLQSQGCPSCSGNRVSNLNSLDSKFPELLKEWDYTKNKILPNEISFGSNKNVWWKCKNGHSYELSVKQKTHKQGCTVCSGKKVIESTSFKNVFPEKAKFWDYKKNINLFPEEVAPFSNKRVWWKCDDGHEWEARIAKISVGKGCPKCSKIKK